MASTLDLKVLLLHTYPTGDTYLSSRDSDPLSASAIPWVTRKTCNLWDICFDAFLAKHLTYNLSTTAAPDDSKDGNALVGIDVLPARSQTFLEIPVSTSPSTQPEPELKH